MVERLLIKPMLKVIENLKLQAMFLGYYGENLEIAIDSLSKNLS